MITILAVAAFSFILGVVVMLTVVELKHIEDCRSIDRAEAAAKAWYAERDAHCASAKWPTPNGG